MTGALALPRIGSPATRISAAERKVAKLISAGLDTTAISQLLGVTTATVGAYARNPKVLDYVKVLDATEAEGMKDRVAAINEKLLDYADECLDEEIDVLRVHAELKEDPKSGRLVFDVARDVLDRVGASAPKRIDTRNLNANIQLNGADIVQVLKEFSEL